MEYLKHTNKGRVVYNRKPHMFKFRDIDRIVADITDSEKLPKQNGDENDLRYIENIVSNLYYFVPPDRVKTIVDDLAEIAGLFLPEWAVEVIKFLIELGFDDTPDLLYNSDIGIFKSLRDSRQMLSDHLDQVMEENTELKLENENLKSKISDLEEESTII